jgi:hypothetical protein
LAHYRQDEFIRKSAEATETIAQVKKQPTEFNLKIMDQAPEAVRSALQQATIANAALGTALSMPIGYYSQLALFIEPSPNMV